MTRDGQIQRILERLQQGDEIPAIELHRAGSGKEHGFCASLSRRISDLRDAGHVVHCRKERQPDGTLHTFYTLNRIQ